MRDDRENVLTQRLRSRRNRRSPMYAQGTTSTESKGYATRKQVPGLSTACSAIAGIVAPFSASMGTLASMGNGSTKLRGSILENPVVGAAYKLVLNDNSGQNEEDVKSQFLSEYPRRRTRNSRCWAAC